MPHKSTTHKKTTSGRRTGPVPHRRPNVFIRLLQRLPGWAWWTGGIAIVAVYVYFFYYIFVGPFGFRWRALYGEVNYPDGYEIHGIDISFEENFREAREYGFTRGAYHFYSVYSPAEQQAAFYIKHAKLENGDLPPVLDVEHKPNHQSDEAFAASVLKWLDIVEKHYGVKPIIYTYYKFKTRYLNDSVFDSYPYWIAHYYVDKVEYEGPWKFWQHTDAGRLPGIKGEVDFNIYNGSFYDLRKMTIGAREQIGEDAYAD